uniref:Uncharacterized protein n=1 Tax=Glossina pallidipes TaxID=7398 RepID=A0A1A9ZSM5_GLOPL
MGKLEILNVLESLGMSPEGDKLNKTYWEICFAYLKNPNTPIEINEELLIYFGYDGRHSVGTKSILGILNNYEPALKEEQQSTTTTTATTNTTTTTKITRDNGDHQSHKEKNKEDEEEFEETNIQSRGTLTVTADEVMFIFSSLSTRMNKYFKILNRYYTRALELIAKYGYAYNQYPFMSINCSDSHDLAREKQTNVLRIKYKSFIEYYKKTLVLNNNQATTAKETPTAHRTSILPYRKFFNEYDKQSTVYGNNQLVLRLYCISENAWALIRRKNCSLTTAEKHLKKRFGEQVVMVHQYIGIQTAINYGEILQITHPSLFIWHPRENILECKQNNKITNKDLYEYLDNIIKKFI